MERNSSHLAGLGYGISAYLMWGSFAAFFDLLRFATPLEILAHRIIWTLVATLVVLAVLGRLRELRAIPAKTWGYAAAAALTLSINWGVYVYGVTTGQVVECALGYFINPLVSVLLGVLLFGERLSRGQVLAVVVALIGVVVLTLDYGRVPYIALILAAGFATYGVIKKLIPLDPLRGLAAEGLVAAPGAVAYLVWLTATGVGTVAHAHPGHLALLLIAGPVTAVPLLLFAAAAQRISLTTIGILQYLTPSLQLAWGVAIGHEAMPAARWAGFAIIWFALAVFTAAMPSFGNVIHWRRPERDRASLSGPEDSIPVLSSLFGVRTVELPVPSPDVGRSVGGARYSTERGGA